MTSTIPTNSNIISLVVPLSVEETGNLLVNEGMTEVQAAAIMLELILSPSIAMTKTTVVQGIPTLEVISYDANGCEDHPFLFSSYGFL